MNINELLAGITNCECGRVHTCPIDFVYIGDSAENKLPELCMPYRRILLVSDKNTFSVFGKTVSDVLSDKIENNLILKSTGEVIIPDEEQIAEIEKNITCETDLIIGVGSGVINDLCKITSFKHALPYFICATAPSMDGYASVGSALILEGMKVTRNARPPKAIIADTSVLKNAPFEMLQAGYGDIIGKYSCLNDWKLASLINGEYFCGRVYDITYSCAQRVKPLASQIAKRNEKAVATLMEALITVGIAMSYVGNSRPASGSEHHLSHFFEITGIAENKKYFPHGIDVAFSSVMTAKLREKIIASAPVKKNFVRDEWESEIRRVYTSVADGVISLQDKLGWYKNDDSEAVYEKFSEIRELLKESPSSDEFLKMLNDIHLDFSAFEVLYGKEKINDAPLYAKDLKDRYTVLWLFYTYFSEV